MVFIKYKMIEFIFLQAVPLPIAFRIIHSSKSPRNLESLQQTLKMSPQHIIHSINENVLNSDYQELPSKMRI